MANVIVSGFMLFAPNIIHLRNWRAHPVLVSDSSLSLKITMVECNMLKATVAMECFCGPWGQPGNKSVCFREEFLTQVCCTCINLDKLWRNLISEILFGIIQ